MLNAVIVHVGTSPAQAIIQKCRELGVGDRLVYSPAFHSLTGGPKWMHPDKDDTVLVRKYIGVLGLGDFTLLLAHPREVLDHDTVVQSHVDAQRWPTVSGMEDRQRFVSIRNPVGIVNSALLSLNALTSEYMQSFLPSDTDENAIRTHLALYKFTDLEFFSGIVRHARDWYNDFLPVQSSYTAMRWEDLLTKPGETIVNLARGLDFPVDAAHANEIWGRIGYRNLTGAHGHNYRRGGGRVGDWRNWLTNAHLEIMHQNGFEDFSKHFGYGVIEDIPKASMTPFQQRVDSLISRGERFTEYEDQDLFCFAFNKSNIDYSAFDFQSYGWREATRVERAHFADAALLESCWEAADNAVKELNTVLRLVLSLDCSTGAGADAAVKAVAHELESRQGRFMPRAVEACIATLKQLAAGWTQSTAAAPPPSLAQPMLIREAAGHNIVRYGGRLLVVPQAAGPVDLSSTPIDMIPGAFAARTYQDALDGAHAAARLPQAAYPTANPASNWFQPLLDLMKGKVRK